MTRVMCTRTKAFMMSGFETFRILFRYFTTNPADNSSRYSLWRLSPPSVLEADLLFR
jgi:hypothetical protein